MSVRKLSSILLLISLWTASSYAQDNSDSGFDVGLTSENDNSTEHVFYRNNCFSDVDCHNLGHCETRDDGKFCNCKNGTSGDFCETVDECVGELEMCRTSDDVLCVFDVELEKAVCKCDNETKTYVPDEERCMKNCISDVDCEHIGKCETRDTGKFCNCKNGTTGDFCETVDECADELQMCGTSDDVMCVFDVKLEKAICKCDNETQTYVPDKERCMENCVSDVDCQHLGNCETRDGRKFCNCKNFTSGDFCETVDECADELQMCGTSDDVMCVFDVELEKAVCKCDNETQTYVPDKERCMENCVSDVDCHHLGNCETRDDVKFCNCKNGTSGDFCETVDECVDELEMCGTSDDVACVFDVELEKAVCKCDNETETYVPDEERCMENCVYDVDCQHLGNCEIRDVGKFCNCKNGTSGDFCETVDECVGELEMCGTSDDVSCVFDVELEKAVCLCDNETKTYVPNEERCMSPCTRYVQCSKYGYCYHKIGKQKFCACALGTLGDYCEIIEWCHTKKVDCGVDNNATCTLGSRGTAYCECDDPTLGFDRDEKVCKDCECGENAKCRLYSWKAKDCECIEGYKEHNGTCKKCDCGPYGYCSFDYEGKKECSCINTYQEHEGICRECSCEEVEECKFLSFDMVVCKCRSGYVRHYGTCTECNCYPGTDCTFNRLDEKKCICPKGYVDYNGTCKVCNCYPGTDCTFNRLYGMKCICPKGYADYNETCKVCDCKLEGANCSFVSDVNTCQCPKGYEQVPDTSNFLKTYCDDIDECKQNYTCPSSTNCSNTIGSYDCFCKDGYEEYFLYNNKKDGCRDIDECMGNHRSCSSRNARCVNTPGSYRCMCPKGYIFHKGHEEKMNTCTYDLRRSRTAIIVVGVSVGIIAAILLVVVIVKRFRNCKKATLVVAKQQREIELLEQPSNCEGDLVKS